MSDHEPTLVSAEPPARRRRSRSLLLGLVLLLCGAAIGGVTTALALRGPFMHGMPKPEELAQHMAHRMKIDYNLGDEQEQRLVAIFEEHGNKLMAIRSEVQPRVEAEHEALQAAVEQVLTPEQAADWRKEFEQKRRPWGPRKGDLPRGSGPPLH